MMHAPETVTAATIDGGEGAADLGAEADGCDSLCCLSATCGSALLSVSHQSRDRIALAARYALPADIRAEAHPQPALKRPPRL